MNNLKLLTLTQNEVDTSTFNSLTQFYFTILLGLNIFEQTANRILVQISIFPIKY